MASARPAENYSKWGDVGYNFLIGQDGTIYEGRALKYEPAHVMGHNRGNIGIAFIGDYGGAPLSTAQVRSGGALVGQLSRIYGIGPERIFHPRSVGPSASFRTAEADAGWPDRRLPASGAQAVIVRVLAGVLGSLALIFVLFTGLLCFQVLVIGSTEVQATVIDRLPAPVRRGYFDNLFTHPTNTCDQCQLQVLSALIAMENRLTTGRAAYPYDYAKLVPLIAGDESEFVEPIPIYSCNVMLLSGDRRVFAAFKRRMAAPLSGVTECLSEGPDRIKGFVPAAYPAVRQRLLSVPEFAPLVRKAG